MSALFSAVASTLLSMAGGSVQTLNVQVILDDAAVAPESQVSESGVQQLFESALVGPADAVSDLNELLADAQARAQEEATEEADSTGTIDPADEPEPVDVVDAGPEIHATLQQLATDFASDETELNLPFAATNSDEVPNFEQTPEFAEEEIADPSPADASEDAAEIDDTLDASESPWAYVAAASASHETKWFHRIGQQVKQCVASLLD